MDHNFNMSFLDTECDRIRLVFGPANTDIVIPGARRFEKEKICKKDRLMRQLSF